MITNHTNSQTELSQKVQFPFGKMDKRSVAFTAVMAETIDNSTILELATLTANATLNLTIATSLPVGAKLYVKIPATATEVLTFGTGFTAPTVTGVAGKTKVQEFIYDGSTFVPIAAAFQIN